MPQRPYIPKDKEHQDVVDVPDAVRYRGEPDDAARAPMHGDLAVLVLGGAVYDTPLSHAILRAADLVIAVDEGYDHCLRLGYVPQLVVGDFDSTREDPSGEGSYVHQLEPAKNMTDGEYGWRLLEERSFHHILLLGGLGPGRLDHVSYHLELLLEGARQGRSMALTNGRLWTRALAGPATATIHFASYFPEDMTVSFVNRTPLKGLSIRGLRWPVDRRDIAWPASLLISNEREPSEEPAFQIHLDSGELLIFLNPEDSGDFSENFPSA